MDKLTEKERFEQTEREGKQKPENLHKKTKLTVKETFEHTRRKAKKKPENLHEKRYGQTNSERKVWAYKEKSKEEITKFAQNKGMTFRKGDREEPYKRVRLRA